MIEVSVNGDVAQKLHAKELLDLGDLVKDVGRFLAQVPSHAGRVSVDWKKVRLPGQTGLVSLIRRVSCDSCQSTRFI